MRTVTKAVTGAAAAALAIVSTAVPAEARGYRDRDGIDAGDVIAGVAIVGGIAAIASALSRDRYDYDGYGYGHRYRDRYRGGYSNAVNACAYQAQRYSRGQVRIVDVDRRGGDRFRIRGVIESGYGGYDRYDRYDRHDHYDRYDRRGGYDRYDRGRSFTCTARGSGRIQSFRFARGYGW